MLSCSERSISTILWVEVLKKREILAPCLSQLLFTHDPMRTCCVENDANGEYDRVAATMVVRMAGGEIPSEALRAALREWFGSELVAETQLADLEQAICAMIGNQAL